LDVPFAFAPVCAPLHPASVPTATSAVALEMIAASAVICPVTFHPLIAAARLQWSGRA
jgi:hypothetical protein